MSVFSVTPDNEVVGWSEWPWDPLYVPVVGCFIGGSLFATASCSLESEEISVAPANLRLLSRIKRKGMRLLGLPTRALPVMDLSVLSGPRSPVWFRFSVPADVAERLRNDDRSVRVERLEDSVVLHRIGSRASENLETAHSQVEDLINEPEGESGSRLLGFPAFLTAPPQLQLEVAFVEYLRRLPERGARDAFLPRLESGEISVLELRSFILGSEEFRSRRIGFGSRLGAMITSESWLELARAETLLAPHRPLQTMDSTGSSMVSAIDFISASYEQAFGRQPAPAEMKRLVDIDDQDGRQATSMALTRLAARRGVFMDVV